MSPALANFLFEAANFLVLAAALGWVLFKPVRRALDAERQQYAAAREKSDRVLAEAELLVEQARLGKQEAERALEQRRQEILTAAQREAAGLLAEARKTERAQRQELARELDAARSAEAEELATVVGELAADAVRRMLGTLKGPSIDMALIRGACEKLERFPVELRRSAQVESARPLDAEAKRVLEGALGGEFTERVVSELGAGVRITMAAGQVDATASSLARHAGTTVRRFAADLSEQSSEGASDG